MNPVGDHSRAVWLDGGAAPGWERPVLAACTVEDPSLSWDGHRVLRHAHGRTEVVGTDPFDALEAELAAEGGDWYGWFGHASNTDFPARPGTSVPEAVWMRPSLHLDLPHPVATRPGTAAPPVPPVPPWYRRAFDQVQARLHAGDSYEVNLTARFRGPGPGDPWQVLDRLRSTNAAPFSGLVAHDVDGARGWLVSSSPEQYLHLSGRHLRTRPIKGTGPRGATPAEDAALAEQLRRDPKIRAENLMITDLLRNDVAQVSEPGSVHVPELMAVEAHPSVHQVVTTVAGTLQPHVGTVAAVRALFPPGSMTGAPKLRTVQIIEQTEATPRGVYSGAWGRISPDGADLAVVIRSLTTAGSGTWEWGTGGGITVDSDVESEWAELCWKAQRIEAALGVIDQP